MKKIFISLSFIIVVCCALAYGLVKKYIRPVEYMSLKKVCKRWGEMPFDSKKFKSSEDKGESVRAKMACSLLKNQKQYIGLDSLKIREKLGSYTGYFFSESFPTYIINSPTKKDKNVWQILFLVDGEHKVSKIVIHKNCCY